jgi:hypothetical protein
VRASPEAVRYAIAALLESVEFEAALLAVYTEQGDAANLRLPAVVYPSIRVSPQQFPCVELDAGRKSRNNPESYALDGTLPVMCYYHGQGADEERLQLEVERFATAVEDFFMMKTDLLPTVMNCSIWTGDVDYSPLTRFGDAGPLLKSAVIEIFVRMVR